MRAVPIISLSALLVLAGCVTPFGLDAASTEADLACVHPHPCGDEWPADLVGEFALKDIVPLEVAAHDGVKLGGAVLLPDLPEDVPAPVILISSPYYGQCASNGGFNCGNPATVPPVKDTWTDHLVRNGYAVVRASVRGTGTSGGCWQMFGLDEQKDQATLVEWAAAQPWSNGRVGMIGHSYLGTTPWMAAIQNPPALKTIVPSGIVSDPYTFGTTPQGAPLFGIGAFWTMFGASNSVLPPIGEVRATGPTPDMLLRLKDRACPDVAPLLEPARSELTDERDAAFWEERRLITRFPDITASVFVVHGLLDNSGHAFQEDPVWSTVNSPKRMLVGQWGHVFPPPKEELPFDFIHDALLPWLDHWLKGIGPAPAETGTVSYQDGASEWRTTSAWPPTEARDEVMHLADGKLAPAPATKSARFTALPTGLCPTDNAQAVFETEPLTKRVVLAGNPYALLRITTDKPGGLLALHLYAAKAGEPLCSDTGESAQPIAIGGADLRFHEGNMKGKDFPVGKPTDVRFDLYNLAHPVEPGERLVLVVSHGSHLWRTTNGQPYFGDTTLGPESHIVLPLVEGTLGGEAPTLDYPPRPFVP